MAPLTNEQEYRFAEMRRARYAFDLEEQARIKERIRQGSKKPARAEKEAEERRFKTYGITPEQYAAMIEAQSGLCAVCGKNKKLSIDHCHETGRVRGLICTNCNTAIGKLGDTVEGLLRALEYLRSEKY